MFSSKTEIQKEFELALLRIKLCSEFNDEIYFKSFESSPEVKSKITDRIKEFDEKYMDERITQYISPEKMWMLCIDARHHELGRLVYDKGLNKDAEKEIGYIDAAETALAFTLRTLYVPLDLNFIKQVHFIGSCNVRYDYGEIKSICDSNSVLAPIKNSGLFQLTELTSSKAGIAEMSKWKFVKMTDNIVSAAEHINIEETIGLFIQELKDNLKQKSENKAKLYAIALFARKLECVHPFYDGNIRLIRLLILKLLAENEFPLTCMQNPNYINGKSTEENTEEIILGISKYLEISKSIASSNLNITTTRSKIG